MRFKSQKERDNYMNGLRGSFALRNSSPGEINARHQAAVADEQKAKDKALQHAMQELKRETLHEISQEKH